MGDVLMRGDRPIIPKKLQQNVLLCAHEGHPGMSAMKRRLRQKVWWPKIDEEVEKLQRLHGSINNRASRAYVAVENANKSVVGCGNRFSWASAKWS
ncbi:AAEL007524-PA [Aedes aegypti]|uniref:RNA-directed DNA polymerase n=1 Tax=Aedes aegypti TaxID=7159 RepID=Q171T7_AEDAE|nr:AAEL007524-PA [Aedes aegypti]